MSQTGHNLYDLSSIYENFSDRLSTEDTISTLSFSDLIFPLTPCLKGNLTDTPLKSPFEMLTMDPQSEEQLLDATEGDYSFPTSPPLAQLSPGVNGRDLVFGGDWSLESPPVVTSKNFDNLPEISEDFEELLSSPIGNLDSEENFQLLFGLVGCDPVEVTDSSKESFQQTVEWLTRTTIAPDDLTLTSGGFTEVAPEEDKQVLQEIVIPLTVPDSILCEVETVSATGSKTKDQKAVKSSPSKSRKRPRQTTEPGTDEYKKKRELNNISVRKSREKARQKQQDTEERADILSTENSRLQARVDSLEKELNILRGLFVNIGATLPSEINTLLSPDVS